MGALAIWECLKELAKDPIGNMGIIHDVVLLGLPTVMPSGDVLLSMRMLIAGRFVHGYSREDWILRFLLRGITLYLPSPIMAEVPIDDIPGVDNIDCSDIIHTHWQYPKKMDELLRLIQL